MDPLTARCAKFQVLKQHPGCVLVPSDVEVCVPFLEPLQVKDVAHFQWQQPSGPTRLSSELVCHRHSPRMRL